eukprot:s5488_g3.t1
MDLLQKGLSVDIAAAEASKEEDKTRILNSVRCCNSFQDTDLRILIDNLPSKLQSLRLDLAYTGLERLDDLANLAGASFGNTLQTLVIRFAGSVTSISGLSALLCPSLRHLELWCSDLPDLEDIELGSSNKALLKLHLEELQLRLVFLLCEYCTSTPLFCMEFEELFAFGD